MSSLSDITSSTYSLRDSSKSTILNSKGYRHIPDNVLLIIFSYFNQDEVVKNLMPVSQQWRSVAEHPSLRKTLKFSGIARDTAEICERIWRYNQAQTIHVRRICEPVDVLRQICRCSENLKHLTLRHCPQIFEDSLRHLLLTCKNLESLDLKGTPFRALIFYEELVLAQSLSCVNFSENPYLLPSNIATIILNCRKLTGFHLSSFKPINKINLTDSDCYFILSHTVLKLNSLTLDCSTLSTYSFPSIMRSKYLKYLCLNYAYNFDSSDFQDMWKSLKNLTSLKIRFARQLTDKSVKTLFMEGKKVMSKLEALDLTGCSGLKDQGVIAIAQCCSGLKSLVLRSCKNVSDIGVVFKRCQALEVLNIAFCSQLRFGSTMMPKNLKILFISDDIQLRNFVDLLRTKGKTVAVKLCESEYNKNYSNI
ncbi:unnamed protein product [Phaedon cochleariae]|uniref:F-box domain-containing protein n=1 Tax=Phaedon cochleariae TaxID=80249 RepID=A0A9P0DBD7_PHACE|nr:unnamed protein product [Phaedon cochleariae]